MEKISVIIPCHNEEESLPLFYKEITKVLQEIKTIEYELVFINDGSKDRTLDVLKELHQKDKQVRYISFSRNFGKEAAIYAGFEAIDGDYAVLIDADLQHPPHYIQEMYQAIQEEGYDSVACRRISRKGEPKIRSFFARCFYWLMNKMSKTEFVDGATDYRMMKRRMYESILELKECNRFTKGIFSWVGFQTKWIPFENVERLVGKSNFSFWGLFKYSLESIVSFSTVPLMMSVVLGVLFCLISFVMFIFVIIKTLLFGDPVAGYPTLICFISLIGGIQLFCLGIFGEYFSKIYLEIKKRPIYIVKETEKDNEL